MVLVCLLLLTYVAFCCDHGMWENARQLKTIQDKMNSIHLTKTLLRNQRTEFQGTQVRKNLHCANNATFISFLDAHWLMNLKSLRMQDICNNHWWKLAAWWIFNIVVVGHNIWITWLVWPIVFFSQKSGCHCQHPWLSSLFFINQTWFFCDATIAGSTVNSKVVLAGVQLACVRACGSFLEGGSFCCSTRRLHSSPGLIRHSRLGSLAWKAAVWFPVLLSCHFGSNFLPCLGAHKSGQCFSKQRVRPRRWTCFSHWNTM